MDAQRWKTGHIDSDNSGGFLLDALYRILDNNVLNLEWTIPHDEMVTTKVLSGVKVAFAHGHKISGKKVCLLYTSPSPRDS